MTRLLTLLGLLLSASAAGAGALAGTSESSAAPAAMVRMSPSGDDSSCARGQGRPPCRTWLRAYAVAQAGDTISIEGGTYAGATLTGSKRVTFRVVPGQTARVNTKLAFTNAANITVLGPLDTTPAYDQGEFYSMAIDGCSSNIDLHDVSGRTFNVTDSSRNVRLYGGEWGGYTARPHSSDSTVGGSAEHPQGPSCGDGIVRDLLLDGMRFHDVQFVDESQWDGAHPDCLESHGAFVNLTIRNSTFERCGNTFFGVYTDWGSFNGLLMENNLFHKTTADTFWGLQVGTKPGFSCANIVFRYNTYDPDEPNAGNRHAPPLIDDCPGSSTHVYGNIIRRAPPGACSGTWSFNVIEEGPACGMSSVVREAFFVARGSNYQLRPGSPAIGRGDPKRFPQRDSGGQRRAVDGSPDAGFDEAQGIVHPETGQLLDGVGKRLTAAAAGALAVGNAACLGRTSAADRLRSSIAALGGSLSRANGRLPKDLCGFVSSSVAAWTYRPALRLGAVATATARAQRGFRSIAKPGQGRPVVLRGTTPASKAVAAAFNAQNENAAAVSELLTAYVTSVGRAQAAGNARDASWQDRQLEAARGYARQAATAVSKEPRLRGAVTRALRRAGIQMPGLTSEEASSIARSRGGGLSSGALRTLPLQGLRAREIAALATRASTLRASELIGVSLTRAAVDRQTLSHLRAASAALRRLGE